MPLALWLEISKPPRTAIRAAVDQSFLLGAVILSLASGFTQSLVTGADHHVGARFAATSILLIALVVGAAWGLFQVSLLAGLLYLVARWTKSRVLFRHLWTALGWANVPQSAALGLWLIGTLLLGRSLYLSPASLPPLSAGFIGLVGLATAVCWIWWAVVVVKAVAEVHHVGAWAAVGHIVGAFALFMAAALILVPVAILLWR